ncbi:14-3-3-like protein [Russula ochroleuca]|uniref:14-3-3-like protein n=1 Tax=Russula ochroleuca TaxID=152965 RepID=A0A9P5JWF7_9AGAM|nr:14-3-3-like protein [Russula ochroleuca]
MSVSHSLGLAKLAEHAERWDDVIKQLKSMIFYSDARLGMEEQNLLSIAYKHITGTLRTSWRTCEKIELELADACKDLLDLLNRYLVPAAEAGEERVFYLKMQGDYYRYLAEFARHQEREQAAQLALEAYKASYKHAFGTLPPWHPTRPGLALNFSVYFHDVYGSPDRACHLAKHAFDEAVGAMHATPEHTFRDSLMILHLLRDDIILWSAEMLRDEGQGEEAAEKR